MKLRHFLPLAFTVLCAAASAVAAPRLVEIAASDKTNAMKFDVTSITAKPGEELQVVLTNNGTMPKESMGHNWVLLKKGTDVAAFAAAAIAAKDTNYIPPALKDQVIARIDVLGPRKSAEVVFKAPAEPGEYVFICSFPAHFQIGMKGVLVVK